MVSLTDQAMFNVGTMDQQIPFLRKHFVLEDDAQHQDSFFIFIFYPTATFSFIIPKIVVKNVESVQIASRFKIFLIKIKNNNLHTKQQQITNTANTIIQQITIQNVVSLNKNKHFACKLFLYIFFINQLLTKFTAKQTIIFI